MDEHSLETIRLELAILYRKLASSIVYRKKMGELDHSAYLLLEHITSHGSAGVKTLADKFQLNISTISRQASALEKKGYVYRIPDPQDRRAYSLQISELGLRALIEFKSIGVHLLTELLKDWSDQECTTFGELLRKFNRTSLED